MKALMLINTSGLDYDDRLRKESLSLRSLGFDSEIVALESSNEAGRRIVYDHICATTIHLHSRGWFASAKGLFLKATEMYVQFLRLVWQHRPEIIWFHNLEQIGLVPILALLRNTGFVKRLIWDQHELFADQWLSSPTWRWLLGRLCNVCDIIVSANEQRKLVLHRALGDRLHTPIEVVENYPDRLFVDSPRRNLPDEARRWLAGRSYVLAQGGAGRNRQLDKLVSAVLGIPDLGLIVIGPYKEAEIRGLRDLHKGSFDERVLLTGYIPQMDIVPYIDHALLSVVLYAMCSENLRLSAPNRLYQAVSRGTPVVVGTNPTMAEFVRKWECGVALKTDGSDAEDIRAGVLAARNRLHTLRQNATKCRESVTWESQVWTIARIAGVETTSRSGKVAPGTQTNLASEELTTLDEEQKLC